MGARGGGGGGGAEGRRRVRKIGGGESEKVCGEGLKVVVEKD